MRMFASSPRLLMVALWSLVPLSASGCDKPIIGGEEALIDLHPGPRQGVVGDEAIDPPVNVDPGGSSPGRTQPGGEGGPVTGPAVPAQQPSPPRAVNGLERLNEVRVERGLRPLVRDEALDEAAQAHADYLAANWEIQGERELSPHREAADLEGFTGVTFTDRVAAAGYEGVARGEVIAYKGSSAAAMEAWLESLYHRLPLLRRELDHLGYGEVLSGATLANVVEVGRRAAPPWEPNPTPQAFVAYPDDGAVEVPFEWLGLERPLPPPPPLGYPSGPVITLSALSGEVSEVSASVVPKRGGGEVALTLLTKANDPHLSVEDIAIIPEEPLEPDSAYEVRVSGLLDGQPFSRRWSFWTRRAGCEIGEGDCSVGRACYPMNGELTCLWEGPRGLDETCEYVNDCQPGLTCMGSRCRPVCDPSDQATDPASHCDAVCPGATVNPYGDDAGYALCKASGCGGAEGCGEGQGCYWASGTLMCGWAGELSRGAACTYANDCAAGLSCLSVNGDEGRCLALCGGIGMPSCDEVCPGASLIDLDDEAGVQACR